MKSKVQKYLNLKRRGKGILALLLALLLAFQPLGLLFEDNATVKASVVPEKLFPPLAENGFVGEEYVIVLFDHCLDPSSVPPLEVFQLELDGTEGQAPSAVSLPGGGLFLELDEPVGPEQQVMLRYQPSAAGALQGENGLKVRAFSLALQNLGNLDSSGDEGVIGENLPWSFEDELELDLENPDGYGVHNDIQEEQEQKPVNQQQPAEEEGATDAVSEPRTSEISWTAAELKLEELTHSSVTFSWPPAESEEGVAGYNIFMNGELQETVAGSVYNSAVGGLEQGSSYLFNVEAEDKDGGSLMHPHTLEVSTLSLDPAEDGAGPVFQEIIVAFRGEFDEEDGILAAYELELLRPLRGGAVLAGVPEERELSEVLEGLRSEPGVRYAEPNYILSADNPDDPLLGQQWGLSRWDGINAPAAWELVREALAGETPSTIVVAVIDSGADHTHEDLQGRVLPGYNVFTEEEGQDAAMDDAYDGHGTRVAGIIAALTNNGIGIAGVAGEFPVSVLPVKALDQNKEGTVSQVADGIYWAADWVGSNGESVSVINLSLGERLAEEPNVLRDAVEYASDRGILVVASAGQDGGTVEGYYPAAFDKVVSVTGVEWNWMPLSGSNSGADLHAPGGGEEGILSTLPGDEYGMDSGSSYAAPFVSGTAALLFMVQPDVDLDTLKFLLHHAQEERQGMMPHGFEEEMPDTVYMLRADQAVKLLTAEALPPAKLRALSDESAVRLWWEAPEGIEIQEYIIYRDGEEIGRPLSETYLDTELEPETAYHYEVCALNIMGDLSGAVEIAAQTLSTVSVSTTRVSVPAAGMPDDEADDYSWNVDISGDGRFVVFSTEADNLVPEGSGGSSQVYMHDRQTSETILVSRAPDGSAGSGTSQAPAVSANGRYAVFESRFGPNLVPDGDRGIYIWDRLTEEMVFTGYRSVWGDSSSLAGISDDGRFLVFCDSNWVYRYDRDANETGVFDEKDNGTELHYIARGNKPSLSKDGRYVVFSSDREIVSGIPAGDWRAYRYDFTEDEYELVSLSKDGEPGNNWDYDAQISPCGQFVSFTSSSGNLVADWDGWGVYLRDMANGVTELVSVNSAGTPANMGGVSSRVSEGGRYVAFISDSADLTVLGSGEGRLDGYSVFIRDRMNERTTLLSVGDEGKLPDEYIYESCFSLSARGLDAAYVTGALNLVPDKTTTFWDIFVSSLSLGSPVWPEGSTLEAKQVGGTFVQLTWSPAVDEIGVAAYRIYQDGQLVGEVDGNVLEYTADGLEPGTAYSFQVQAGNGHDLWSSDGPSLSCFTSEETLPGEAGLIVTALEGGRAELAWDPAPAELPLSGYRIFRADGEEELQPVADVGAEVTSYTDPGLAAESLYAYRVKILDGEGETHPHTVAAEITTPSLFITRARWTSPDYNLPLHAIAMEGTLNISLEGELSREAAAEISYYSRLDEEGGPLDDPVLRSAAVQLEESEPLSGTYRGAYTLPAGTVELVEVKVVLSDGHEGTVERGPTGPLLPLSVKGGLKVQIDSFAGTLEGDLLTAWSNSLGHGENLRLDGPGTYRLSRLPAADDYRLRIVTDDGFTLDEVTQLTVAAGVFTETSLTPRFTASLQFRLLHPGDGQPVSRVRVICRDAETGQTIRGRMTDAEGWTEPFSHSFAVGDRVQVSFRNISFPLHQDPLEIEIGQDNLIYKEVTLDWHPEWVKRGYIEGYVRDEDGNPLEGASISAYSGWETTMTESTVTDKDGYYRLLALSGNVALHASWSGERADRTLVYHNDSLELGPSEELSYDLTVQEMLRYTIAIESLELRYPGEEPEIIDSVDGITAQNFKLNVRTSSALPQATRRLVSIQSQRYPLEVVAPPGTPLILQIDGKDYGLPEQSLTVTTGDEQWIGVSFVLDGTGGGTFKGRVLDAHGEPFEGPWTLIVSAKERRWAHQHEYQDSDFAVRVPEAGAYRFSFSYWGDTRAHFRTERSIGAGDTVELPPVMLQSIGNFGGTWNNELVASPTAINPGMQVNVRVNYRNYSQEGVEEAELLLSIPEGLELVPGTLFHNNEPVHDALETEDGPALPIGEIAFLEQGTVRFQVELEENTGIEEAVVLARMSYLDHEAVAYNELIGNISITLVNDVELMAPARAYQRDIELHGRAPGGTDLYIFAAEKMLGRTKAAPNGFWEMEVALPYKGERWWHELKAVAVAADGSELFSPSVLVLYDESQPRVVEARFRQNLEAWPEMEHLANRFSAAGAWTVFHPGYSVPRFPRQMLAGFPFQFQLTFDEPDKVENVVISVDGPAGGRAELTRGEDDIYRGTIVTNRGATWRAGPIHVEYDTFEAAPPTWSGTASWGEPELPAEGWEDVTDEDVLTADSAGGVKYAARVPYEAFGGDLVGDYTFFMETGYTGSAGSPMDAQSVNWSISHNRFSVTVVGYMPLSDLIDRDRSHPTWPEESRLIAAKVEDDSIELEWDPAGDQLWVDKYYIYQDGAKIGEVPGDSRRYTATGLTPGRSYTFSVAAADPGDRWCDGGPEVEITAGNTTAALSGDALSSFRKESEKKESEREAVLRGASATFERLRTVNRWTGRIARPVNLLDWGRETAGLGGEFDRLDAILEGLSECMPPGALSLLEELVNRAKEALLLAHIVEGVSIGAAFAAAATGVGLPGSAVLTAASLASGWALRRRAANAENRVEEEKARLENEFGECEDPEDVPDHPGQTPGRRVNQPLANPAWKIDPSGYVYEVVEENRIEGVTATVLRSKSEDGPWEVWDADWYGEINPQQTDLDGRYGWDVPPDWWMVFYEKDGYEPAYSDALPVPPPHFDVNIPLKYLGAPAVDKINGALDGEAVEINFNRYMRKATLTESTIRLFNEEGEEVEGTVEFLPDGLVPNPHEEGEAKELTLSARFVPSAELPLGEEFNLRVSGLVQSYAEVPMGEEHEEMVSILTAYEVTMDLDTEAGGSASGYGVYADGAEATLLANPYEFYGYEFAGWFEDGQIVSSDAEYTFTVEEDRHLTARFRLKEYSLAVEVSHGQGTVNITPHTPTYTHGTEVTLDAVPAEGWRFNNWSRNVDGRKSATTTITMEGNEEVSVDFRELCRGVTGVELDQDDRTLEEGATVQLSATVVPPDATDKAVTWSSDHPSVATVNAEGLVTAVAAGRAAITVTTRDGDFTDSVVITVTEAPSHPAPSPGPGPSPGPAPIEDEPDEADPEGLPFDPSREAVLEFPEKGLTIQVPVGAIEAPEGKQAHMEVTLAEQLEVEALPPGYSGIGLQLNLVVSAPNTAGELVPLRGSLPEPLTVEWDLSGYDLSGFDPEKICLFRYMGISGEWSYVQGRFDPETGILTALVDHLSTFAPLLAELTFPDLEGHWARRDIEILAGRQLVRGFDPETFAPARPVTRAEFATLILRLLGIETPEKVNLRDLPFTDITVDDWYAGMVLVAYNEGLIKGVSPHSFEPLRPVTRQELAVLIYRALLYLGMEDGLEGEQPSALLSPYDDSGEIASWAKQALAWAVQGEIMGGRTETILAPKGTATRAEAAVMIKRLLDHTCPF